LGLERIEAVHLGSRAFESISSDIALGALAAGETRSDRTLGVSGTPEREALRRLEDADLVGSYGRAGWVVASFTESHVHELFQLRRSLEPLGIAALRRTPT
jgi:GntR family transcriptional regulator, rspAB operon transcriptional repressor